MADKRHTAAATAPLIITMGEPAGIGPEIIAKAFAMRAQNNLPPLVAAGNAALLAQTVKNVLPEKDQFEIVACPDLNESIEARQDTLPVFDFSLPVPPEPGKPNSVNAKTVTATIEWAVAACMQGKARGIVTAPIHKAAQYDSGFSFPGHTEFLAHLTSPPGAPLEPLMLLVGAGLRVALVTIHLPISKVPSALSVAGIVAKGRALAAGLKKDFALSKPRLGVTALNPHAGEDGTLGREEIETIAPAVRALQDAGIVAEGPLPADTAFHEDARNRFDAVLCMYHDQALIPLKTLDFQTGVNVTLGLPIVRTSPDHGTAMDIAGQNRADASSMLAAIKTANEIAKRRAAGQ